jgi:hypothetical protein
MWFEWLKTASTPYPRDLEARSRALQHTLLHATSHRFVAISIDRIATRRWVSRRRKMRITPFRKHKSQQRHVDREQSCVRSRYVGVFARNVTRIRGANDIVYGIGMKWRSRDTTLDIFVSISDDLGHLVVGFVSRRVPVPVATYCEDDNPPISNHPNPSHHASFPPEEPSFFMPQRNNRGDSPRPAGGVAFVSEPSIRTTRLRLATGQAHGTEPAKYLCLSLCVSEECRRDRMAKCAQHLAIKQTKRVRHGAVPQPLWAETG